MDTTEDNWADEGGGNYYPREDTGIYPTGWIDKTVEIRDGADKIVARIPDRHPSSQKFHDLLTEAGRLHDKKRRDYGSDDDPFLNVRASENFGTPGWIGAMMRANDKMVRIQTAAKGRKLANESLRDSLMDLAVYSLIAIVLLEENE